MKYIYILITLLSNQFITFYYYLCSEPICIYCICRMKTLYDGVPLHFSSQL